MEANRVGRKVGIGTRLLARLLHRKAQQDAVRSASRAEKNAPLYKDRGRRLGKGSRRFGLSIWQPFAHASSMLWLEITGLFFALFTLFFASNLWKLRADWLSGPSHARFILYAVITAAFLYFAISSFVRAARISRAQRKNQ